MEVIWLTEKVVDPETDVITHIDWSARAWEGVFEAKETGRAELPSPDPQLVAQYLIRPTPEQEKRGVTWDDLADPPGFIRAEWVERDLLHPWLFAVIDRDEIERRLIASVRAQQGLKPPAPDPTAALEAIREKLEEGARDNGGPEGMEYGAGPQIITKQEVDDLLAMTEADAAEAVKAMKADRRKRFTELLFAELADLKNLHGVAGEDLIREGQIQSLIGLFARLGEV